MNLSGINSINRAAQHSQFRGWLANLHRSARALLNRIKKFGRKPRLIYSGWEVRPSLEEDSSGVRSQACGVVKAP